MYVVSVIFHHTAVNLLFNIFQVYTSLSGGFCRLKEIIRSFHRKIVGIHSTCDLVAHKKVLRKPAAVLYPSGFAQS